MKFIISRQLPLVFRRRVLSINSHYGKISPDSSISTCIQIESGATKYITARELVSKLLEFDNNIIKAAREVEPNISKISKDLLARFYGGDDEELLDRITAPFY